MNQDDLLPGEHLILTRRASVVLSRDDLGLGKLGLIDAPNAVLKGRESIGGRLDLTDQRLVFTTHQVNRASGRFSVFLPVIRALRDTSRFLVRRIEVETTRTTWTFIVYGIPALLAATRRAGQALTPDDTLRILRGAREHPERVGAGVRAGASGPSGAAILAVGRVDVEALARDAVAAREQNLAVGADAVHCLAEYAREQGLTP
jgi:hypothetical protein